MASDFDGSNIVARDFTDELLGVVWSSKSESVQIHQDVFDRCMIDDASIEIVCYKPEQCRLQHLHLLKKTILQFLLETLTTDEAPVDIHRIASEIEAQDDVEKEKPELVDADNDSPIPFAQMVKRLIDDGDGIQYSSKANKINCNDSTANQGQSAEPPHQALQAQEAQDIAVEVSQERTDEPEPAVESFDLPLLEEHL